MPEPKAPYEEVLALLPEADREAGQWIRSRARDKLPNLASVDPDLGVAVVIATWALAFHEAGHTDLAQHTRDELRRLQSRPLEQMEMYPTYRGLVREVAEELSGAVPDTGA